MSLTSEVTSMVKEIIRTLYEGNESLVTAESITAGGLSSAITSVEGSSQIFLGAIVAYQNHVKAEVLGIDEAVIAEHTVYSQEVAQEMAINCRSIFNTDYAIATTGNAGPAKGNSEAEIGVVFIAIATPNEVFVEEFNFGQPREKVIDRAVNKALEWLYKEISKN